MNKNNHFLLGSKTSNKRVQLRRHFYSFLFMGIIGVTIINYSSSGYANCPQGDQIRREKGADAAVQAYAFCAIGENDESAQIRLAQYYQNKESQTNQDKMKMVFYYHLAAENGNAHAQVSLAKLLTRMDSNDSERAVLSSYMEQMKQMMKGRASLFKGEMLHPYALLMLAAEDANQKWYYPTTQKSNAEAKILLNNYQIDPARKREVIRQATLWKQQKMKETAKEVLTVDQYKAFMKAVYPEKGRADAFERGQAVNLLKEKTTEYLR